MIDLSSTAFKQHKNLRLVCFSYLTGSDLYHKIALLNREIRASLPDSGLLDQIKILTAKQADNQHLLKYALRLADVIQLILTPTTIENANQMAKIIDYKNEFSTKKTKIDLTIDNLNDQQYNTVFDKELDKTLIVRKFNLIG